MSEYNFKSKAERTQFYKSNLTMQKKCKKEKV